MTTEQIAQPSKTTAYRDATFAEAIETLSDLKDDEVIVILGSETLDDDVRMSFRGTMPAGKVDFYYEHRMLLRYEFGECMQLTISEDETIAARRAFDGVELELITGQRVQVRQIEPKPDLHRRPNAPAT